MKKIQELLNLDLGRKFDTPKKLNRSEHPVPAAIVEKLEEGEFTAEMIEGLRAGTSQGAGLFGSERAGGYPLFYYRTCITIHGAWPKVTRERIGGYKNVIQNGNGSIEIRWNAIDADKIRGIADTLSGTGTPWRYSHDSSGRRFTWMEAITKANFEEVRARMEPRAQALTALPIFGHVRLFVGQSFFGTFLVCEVTPLAIRAADVTAVTLALFGGTAEELKANQADHDLSAYDKMKTFAN